MNRLEQTILKNLIYNEKFCRKVLPFIKKEYFSDDVEEEAKIVEMIKLHIQQTNEEEPNHEYNFNYSEEEFNEHYGYLTRKIKPPQQEGLIKNFFDQYNFTKKELTQIIDIANKKLAQLV